MSDPSSDVTVAAATHRTRHLFSAPLGDTVLGFGLPARAPAAANAPGRRVLDAAAALAQAEPWLAALEDWLGTGLLPEPGAAQAFDQHVLVIHPDSGARLHLPMAALQHTASPPPAALADWDWRPVACELVLDALPLDDTDLADLLPGALLLLPAAFGNAWTARLLPLAPPGRAATAAHAVQLVEQRGRLCVSATGDAAPPPDSGHATVRFVHRVEARAAQLMGWDRPTQAAGLDTPLLLANGALVLHGPAAQGALPLAAGQLFPVGAGFGMRIERLADPATFPGAAHASPQTPFDLVL